jgi:ketopantoate reductase
MMAAHTCAAGPVRRLKILVYGAGAIGNVYAAKLCAADEDVTLLARGQRLAALRSARDRARGRVHG